MNKIVNVIKRKKGEQVITTTISKLRKQLGDNKVEEILKKWRKRKNYDAEIEEVNQDDECFIIYLK